MGRMDEAFVFHATMVGLLDSAMNIAAININWLVALHGLLGHALARLREHMGDPLLVRVFHA